MWLTPWVLLFWPGDEASSAIEVPSIVLRAIDHVEVAASEYGKLSEAPARPGDRVERGTLLARIEDAEAQSERNKADLQLRIARQKAGNAVDLKFAQKSHEVDKAELRRGQESLQRFPGSISASEMDRLRLSMERSELAVEQARHDRELAGHEAGVLEEELRIAESRLERRRIVSPIDGVVVEVKRQAGEWVQPGQTVARVLGLDRLQAEGFVTVRQTALLRVGAPATLTVVLPDERTAQFKGQVTFLSPEVDPVTNEVRVHVEVENTRHELKPGFRGRLIIGATDRPEAREAQGRRGV
jgi:macrolide-specific efflux system membrane fusion protein